MSFLSVLKTIGRDILAADVAAAPFVSLLNPAAGVAMNTIAQLAIKAEQTIQGEKQGATKKQIVMDEFTALLPMFQSALKDQAGLTLTVDANSIGQMIDAAVAGMNAAKAFHDGLKIEKAATA